MVGRRTDDGAPVQADRDVEIFLKRKSVRLALSTWFRKATENKLVEDAIAAAQKDKIWKYLAKNLFWR